MHKYIITINFNRLRGNNVRTSLTILKAWLVSMKCHPVDNSHATRSRANFTSSRFTSNNYMITHDFLDNHINYFITMFIKNKFIGSNEILTANRKCFIVMDIGELRVRWRVAVGWVSLTRLVTSPARHATERLISHSVLNECTVCYSTL